MLMMSGNVQEYANYVLEYAEYEVNSFWLKAINPMLQKGLSVYLKVYLSMRSISLKRLRGWQNILNSVLGYGKYENQ